MSYSAICTYRDGATAVQNDQTGTIKVLKAGVWETIVVLLDADQDAAVLAAVKAAEVVLPADATNLDPNTVGGR